ncbi:CBS domain-containing protein CBSX3, mitochondrial [Galdieria sulphuraria]|uniref:IMP dehydrogenase n=1 Tax=Galdieria sulphuraria TaxID=130081 RepID=M2W8E0_GALSU|nr:IMP dehydrogenase [Galdieria sulphuraria]EME32146.1 IMP dehydrogenase [Galdieria sulphuraria]GJD09570.1 CBS domain-containing protein CBSX3, mitochondrial [Galdieria sulphuraria]|eukprot:XP_005708666.1 IMP dehydrogenase [Galdieria sulphuraria]
MYAVKTLFPLSLLQSTVQSPMIFKEVYSPIIQRTCRVVFSKEPDVSLSYKKGCNLLPQQSSPSVGVQVPVRLLVAKFGLLLNSSSVHKGMTTKFTKRQVSDIRSAVETAPGKTVGDILKVKGEKFYRIKTTDFVYDAIKKMVDNNVGSLVVIDVDGDGITGKPLGIVTERDYLRKIVLLGRSSKTTYVKDIMTSANNLVSVSPSASLNDCMELMTQKRIRHIPVIDNDGNVKGMVSIGDIVKELVEEHRHEAKKLNEYIQGTY